MNLDQLPHARNHSQSAPALPHPCWVTLRHPVGLCHFTQVKCFRCLQHPWGFAKNPDKEGNVSQASSDQSNEVLGPRDSPEVTQL